MSALDVFPHWLWLTFAGLFGSIWGSFANVVVWRWPQGQSVSMPPSHCPTCGALIAPYDNVPVLSWIFLGGRCRSCGVSISARYPMIELSVGLLSAAVFRDTVILTGHLEAVPLIEYGVAFAFCWALVVIAFIDLATQLIPTTLTSAITALGLASHLLLPGGSIADAAIGVVGGFGVVWALGQGYRLLRGEEGMGLGDAHLLAMVGAVLGWQGAMFCLVAGAVQGALTQLVMVAAVRGWRRGPVSPWRRPVPFGPFLAIGALEYVIFGDRLTPLYRALLNL